MPLYFVSAADGTNVVQIFEDTLHLAKDFKENPPAGDFMSEVMDLLKDEALFPGDDE